MLTNIYEYPSSQIDVIYLDFSNAFDKVGHGVILHILKDIGITGVLGKWMYEFINNRKQQVRLKGGSSHKISVLNGVLQENVLSTVLLLILISDISIIIFHLMSFALQITHWSSEQFHR